MVRVSVAKTFEDVKGWGFFVFSDCLEQESALPVLRLVPKTLDHNWHTDTKSAKSNFLVAGIERGGLGLCTAFSN